jgi:6-phosphogluconolactonase (cycloisomerase 2 family)
MNRTDIRRTAALVAAVTASLIGAAQAQALVTLSQFGVPQPACLSTTGSNAFCATGLTADDPSDLALTADGKSAFAVSSGSDALAVLSRNTVTGQLRQVACITELPTPGCLDGAGLLNPTAVAVAPTGKSVYVSWSGTDGQSGVTHFARNTTTGALTPAGCFAVGGADGCTPMANLGYATDVAVSADSKSVFVTGGGALLSSENSMVVFKRDTTTGALTRTACFRKLSAPGCTVAPGLGRASGVTASPDNKSVYVTSSDGAIAVFKRNPSTLAVTQPAGTAGCLAPSGAGGCANAGPAMGGARDLAMTADNKSLYVVAAVDDAVVTFARNTTTGALTPAGCISQSGAAGCTGGLALDGPVAVAAAKDKKSVYVASFTSNAVVDFARNTTTGALTQKDCVATATAPCATGVAVGAPAALAVSADSKSVYVGSTADDAIAAFARTTTAADIGRLKQLETPPPGCFSDPSQSYQPLPCTPAAIGTPRETIVTQDAKALLLIGNGALHTFARSTTTGRLTGTGCIGALGGCASDPDIGSPRTLRASFDSKSVYVTDGARIIHLRRNPTTGALTRESCVAQAASPTCAAVPTLGPDISVAVTKDGKSVYAASFGAKRVTLFKRNTTTGALTAAGCLAAAATPGCTVVAGLGSGSAIAATADGKSVFLSQAADTSVPRVLVFSRNVTTGALTPVGCLTSTDTSATSCTRTRGLLASGRLAVSPDGKSLYVSSSFGGTGFPATGVVSVLVRNTTTGALAQPAGQAGCIADPSLAVFVAQPQGCAEGRGLAGAYGLTVSPDGKTLYSGGEGSMAALNRSTAAATIGQLSQDPGPSGCVTSGGTASCLQAVGFATPAASIALSPNSTTLYVAGGQGFQLPPSGSLTAFARDPTG